jgi:hypothetical protein
VNVPNAWPGNRNPVLYTTLEDMGISVDELKFHPMPEQEGVAKPKVKPLTFDEAKAGLAQMFNVDPSAIEITIRA